MFNPCEIRACAAGACPASVCPWLSPVAQSDARGTLTAGACVGAPPPVPGMISESTCAMVVTCADGVTLPAARACGAKSVAVAPTAPAASAAAATSDIRECLRVK